MGKDTAMTQFVHLHTHTDHSVLDGICRIPNLVKRAKELDMTAVAMTDHGNMSGALEFYKTAKKEGIKPIIGCEVYYVNDMKEKKERSPYHLVLLAKDIVGHHNLIKITSAGYIDGFYYRPRVDLELISKYSQGLIAMTACIAGYVPSMIIEGNINESKAELGRLKEIFKDDLYIEVMDHGIKDQKIANPELIRLGSEFNIPIVATNDVHYINSDDYFSHLVSLCIRTGKIISDPDKLPFDADQYYFKTTEEMGKLFPEEYLTRTLEIAEKCDLDLDLSTTHLPKFPTPDNSDPDSYLWQRIQEGIQQRYNGNISQAHTDRVAKEYDVIRRTGFSGYFLIIDDMVQYAKSQCIRFGPRGSVIGSLVSYLLGITDIDPMPYGLLFERFLTEDRVSPPDIDIDFNSERREEVINYLQRKYGYTAQIVTFNRLSPRSLVRDVGKVLNIGKAKIDSTAKSIPQVTEPEDTLSKLQSQILELNSINPKVITIGTKLHGVIRHNGKHPGGVVVSDKPISDLIPLCIAKGITLTQFDKKSVEAAGLLKIDILGSPFLLALDKALKLIEQRHGIQLADPAINDQATYDLICSGDVSGIFQLGQECGKQIVEKMLPRSLDDLIQLISIDRPGVLSSGYVDRYFAAKSSGMSQYLHPDFEPILSETFGIIIYQEQIMRIAVEIAGFDWNEADRLRKAVTDQEAEQMEPFKDKFISGLTAKGIPQQAVEELWVQFLKFGKYCFNKSHAVGYAKLTYMTAYLKTHYPIEYLSSLISVRLDDKDERNRYIRDVIVRGIGIHVPDVNISTDVCSIVNDTVYLPLSMIKGVGPTACEAIIIERSKGAYKSVADFCERVNKRRVNKNVRRNLAKAGAFDGLYDRSSLLKRIFNAGDDQLMIMEKEMLGLYVSGYLSDSFWYNDGSLHINEINNLSLDDEFTTIGIVGKVYEHSDRNGNTMAFITLEDNTGQLEVVIFSSEYTCPLTVGDMIFMKAKLSHHDPSKATAVNFSLLHSRTLD
jgi:DNA polymerase III subunit alpha